MTELEQWTRYLQQLSSVLHAEGKTRDYITLDELELITAMPGGVHSTYLSACFLELRKHFTGVV